MKGQGLADQTDPVPISVSQEGPGGLPSARMGPAATWEAETTELAEVSQVSNLGKGARQSKLCPTTWGLYTRH